MAKLHELLAVENDLEGTFRKIIDETKVTFTKKADHFVGWTRRLDMFDADAVPIAPEHKEMASTVEEKLAYQQKHIERYLNATYEKEATNQEAVADLIVDGVTIAEALPATFLLGLENRLRSVRDAYSAIPTLPPGIKWIKDESQGKGVYKMANPEETFKTEKVVEPVVLYDATKEHPAQVKESTKMVNVGKYTKEIISGMFTPAEKSERLARIDRLLRAVKKARQRANMTKVMKAHGIAKKLFNYIND